MHDEQFTRPDVALPTDEAFDSADPIHRGQGSVLKVYSKHLEMIEAQTNVLPLPLQEDVIRIVTHLKPDRQCSIGSYMLVNKYWHKVVTDIMKDIQLLHAYWHAENQADQKVVVSLFIEGSCVTVEVVVVKEWEKVTRTLCGANASIISSQSIFVYSNEATESQLKSLVSLAHEVGFHVTEEAEDGTRTYHFKS